MGSPSYVTYQEIEVYEEKLKEFKELIAVRNVKEYWETIEFVGDKDIELNIDEYKIIQYWYKEFLEFLEEIASFIKEGTITLHCPDFAQYGEIHFNEGRVWLMLSEELQRYELGEMR